LEEAGVSPQGQGCGTMMSPHEDDEGQSGFNGLWEMGSNADICPGSEDEGFGQVETKDSDAFVRRKTSVKGGKEKQSKPADQQDSGRKVSGGRAKSSGGKGRAHMVATCNDVTIFPRRKAGQDKLGSNRPPIVVSRQVLESYFDMPQQAVCKKLVHSPPSPRPILAPFRRGTILHKTTLHAALQGCGGLSMVSTGDLRYSDQASLSATRN